jgi:hypothetical protein
MSLDLSQSLSSGTAVFLLDGVAMEEANGTVRGSVIFAGPQDGVPLSDVLAHERVHIAQRDQAWTLWGEPLESWVLEKSGAPTWLAQRMVIGAVPRVIPAMASAWLSRAQNPLEIEATFLEIRTLRANGPGLR